MDNYGLLAVFILIFFEYACAPISSEILLPLSGIMSKELEINFFLILLISVIAGILGALVCYMIGRIGGRIFIDKIKEKIPKLNKPFDISNKTYIKYQNLSTAIARLIPVCRTYISFLAGINKQNIFSYIISSSIGITIWNSCLIYAGYYFKGNEYSFKMILFKYRYLIFFVICLTLIIAICKKEVKHKKNMI